MSGAVCAMHPPSRAKSMSLHVRSGNTLVRVGAFATIISSRSRSDMMTRNTTDSFQTAIAMIANVTRHDGAARHVPFGISINARKMVSSL